MGVV
jgi:hypothetical protein